MPTPLRLSVVTPVYNTAPEFLKELETSLRNAIGDADMEWLLVDDNSSRKETLDCLQELAALPHVRLEKNEGAPGAAGARNFGVSLTSAERLFFIDSDDLLEPGSVGNLLELMEQNPSIRWLTGTFERFSEQQPEPGDSRGTALCEPEHVPDAVDRLVFETFVYQGSYIVDRALYLEAGGFDERFRIGEDWLLWMKMAARKELYYCPMRVLWQRRGHQSMMTGPLINTQAIVAPYLAARKDPRFSGQRKLLRWRIFRLYRILSRRNQALDRRLSTIKYAWLAALWGVNEPQEWANALRSVTGSELR